MICWNVGVRVALLEMVGAGSCSDWRSERLPTKTGARWIELC